LVVIRPASERSRLRSPETPSSRSELSRLFTYACTFGRTYEFMQAVSVRSYSRNSGSTSEEIVTGKPG